jgi:exopolysaccharide biosynthesis polyprenyl glycosylphosphotransferase
MDQILLDDQELLAPARRRVAERPAARSIGARSRYRRLALGVALTDGLALDAALVLSTIIRVGSFSTGPTFFLTLALVPVAVGGLFAVFKLYELHRLSPADEFRRILEALLVGSLLRIVILAQVSGAGFFVSKWTGLTLVLSALFVFGSRFAWHKYLGRLRLQGKLFFRTLVLGVSEEAMLIDEVLSAPASGFVPVGFVRTDGGPSTRRIPPDLGALDDLGRILDEQQVECVFVASSTVSPEQTKKFVREIRRRGIDIWFSANLMEMLASRLTVHPVGRLLAFSLQPVELRGARAFAKRSFDLVVATLAVLAAAPLLIFSALAIKLTSRGPVLFKQERIGRGGHAFTMYKFRTMVHGAKNVLGDLAERNEARGPLFKMRNDPRVTKVGRVLRRFSLDELPQLLNVILGEMSVVGPRPPLRSEVEDYEEWHMDRLEVRPGITGLWQVNRGGDWKFDDYVRLDLFYIENWSITYDLFLLLKTIPAILRRGGNF